MTVIAVIGWSESAQKAIREQLDRILHSACSTNHSAGSGSWNILSMKLWPADERLKGYDVALAVFGRPETFDPIVDPVVRIEAARLRDKLREYYERRRPTRSRSHRFAEGPYSRKSSFGTTMLRELFAEEAPRKHPHPFPP